MAKAVGRGRVPEETEVGHTCPGPKLILNKTINVFSQIMHNDQPMLFYEQTKVEETEAKPKRVPGSLSLCFLSPFLPSEMRRGLLATMQDTDIS